MCPRNVALASRHFAARCALASTCCASHASRRRFMTASTSSCSSAISSANSGRASCSRRHFTLYAARFRGVSTKGYLCSRWKRTRSTPDSLCGSESIRTPAPELLTGFLAEPKRCHLRPTSSAVSRLDRETFRAVVNVDGTALDGAPVRMIEAEPQPWDLAPGPFRGLLQPCPVDPNTAIRLSGIHGVFLEMSIRAKKF